MKKISVLFALLLGCLSVMARQEVLIIPAPQSLQYGQGELVWKKSLNIACSSDLSEEATLLKSCLSGEFESTASINDAGAENADIKLTIDEKMKSMPAGAYELIVHSNGVDIRAAEKSGIYYGIQSLLQIIHKEKHTMTLRKLAISDFPAFQWRGFMLDESRYFKGKEAVKDLLDRMGRLKMNVFHWHLTDDQGWRIEIKKYPLLTEIGSHRDSTQLGSYTSKKFDGIPHSGFYTQDDIKDIVRYANERHITIVPEIEMPGHATAAVAAYPWLGVTGKPVKVSCFFGSENFNVLNVADPKVMQFVEDVIGELITLFPSRIIHVGGDEVRYNQWKESPYIQEYMKQNNITSPSDLQVQFTNRVSNLIKNKGVRMIGWNDITGDQLHDFQSSKDIGSLSQKLADGTIVQFWKGDPALIQKTAENGYDIVNSFHEYTYLDYSYQKIPLEKAYSFNPVPGGFPEHLKNKILGGGCQMWSEWIPTVKLMYGQIFPRMAAYAEGDWTLPQNKNYKHFKRALSHLKSNASIYPKE